MTEVEMVGWHHQLNGHWLTQAPGDSKGQGGLACCSPSGRRVRHNRATEQPQIYTAYKLTDPTEVPGSLEYSTNST